MAIKEGLVPRTIITSIAIPSFPPTATQVAVRQSITSFFASTLLPQINPST